MIDRYMDWCKSLRPEWIGFAIWMMTLFVVAIAFGMCLFMLITFLQFYIFVPIFVLIAYVWIIALFFQEGN